MSTFPAALLNGLIFLSYGSKVKFPHPNSPAFHRKAVLGLQLSCVAQPQLSGTLQTAYGTSWLFISKGPAWINKCFPRSIAALHMCKLSELEGNGKSVEDAVQFFAEFLAGAFRAQRKINNQWRICVTGILMLLLFIFIPDVGYFPCSLSTFALNLGR